MSEQPPNDELRALIALEKQALVHPGAARERLAQRLTAQLSPTTPSADAAPPSADANGSPGPAARSRLPRLRGWWLPVMTGIVSLGAGILIGTALPKSTVEIRYVDRIVEIDRIIDGGAPGTSSSSAGPSSPGPSSPGPSSPGPSSPPPSRSARGPSPAPASKNPVSDEELARERQVIDKARSALSRRDAIAALTAIEEHTRAFPRGQLVEMREALAVQALVYAERTDEARARADRFHRAFPGSMYASVVDGAISSIP